MEAELWIRFLIGGVVVSLFSVVGDLFRPKSFAGLFGAAPSVALATLGFAIAKHGGLYGAIEGRSMVVGAVALFLYSQTTCWLLMRKKLPALASAGAAAAVWFLVAFGAWGALLR